MPKNDITLVNPPLMWHEKARMDLKPPLNLLYLASFLNENGFKANVLDVVSENIDLDEAVIRACSDNPTMVGVPFYQGTFQTSIDFLNKVKKFAPKILTIGGGPMMTTSYDLLMATPSLDFGVIGEGEETLKELLSKKNTSLESISGLVYKKNKEVFVNKSREHIKNLDELPFIDFSLIKIEKYLSFQEQLGMPKWLFLSTSRGCSFKCTFCATPVLWPGKMRRVGISRLIKELKHYKSLYPTANFGFMDDSFFSDKTWLNEFFDRIPELGRLYCCIGRADHLENADILRMAKTGCHYVALGVETGVQRRQKEIRKFLNLEKVKASIRGLAENGILTKCFFMLGFPNETINEMIDTINFAVDCAKLGMTEAGFFPVSAYPGTELAGDLSEELCMSSVYMDTDGSNKAISEFCSPEERAEKRLSIYANIPEADLNKFLNRKKILKLIKLAYVKVELQEYLTFDDLAGIISQN